jgi:two-component system cell cycle response regulator
MLIWQSFLNHYERKMSVKTGYATRMEDPPVAGKILIVDDIATNRIVLKVKLASAYYETVQASCGAEALRLAAEIGPDLVLLDLELPDMSGIDVCSMLKADPATRDIPVVMITAFHDAERKLAALRAGAEDIFWKPFDELVLLARLRSLLRARETQRQQGLRDGTYRELGFAEPSPAFTGPGLIGLVAGRVETAAAWKNALQPYLGDRLVVMDRDTALSHNGGKDLPDVFVVGANLLRPGDGLQFLSELRSRPATHHAAVCLILAGAARDTSAMALDLGADDFFETTMDPAEMALRLQTQMRRKRQSDRFRSSLADGLRLAMIDPLTGLHNRRYAFPYLAQIAKTAQETEHGFGVLIMDLDRFKLVNDTYGHAAGDEVLVTVAERLRANLRDVDLVARIGGEEFLVALPDTSIEAAHAMAERLRRGVADQLIRLPGGASLSVTLSIGLAMCGAGEPPVSVETLIARADAALLAAKADGRNQVNVGRSAA